MGQPFGADPNPQPRPDRTMEYTIRMKYSKLTMVELAETYELGTAIQKATEMPLKLPEESNMNPRAIEVGYYDSMGAFRQVWSKGAVELC